MIQKDYISKNHSKFLIKYHVIFVCKYRKKLLIGAVEYDMKQIMQNISDLSDFNIEVMETDKDHIHMIKNRFQSYRPLVGFALLFFPIVFLFPTVNQPLSSINSPCLL